MTTFVDVQLIEGLGLPYAPGAEAGLLDSALDPGFNDAWQAFVAIFPALTLVPLFDELPVEQLADLVDGIRVSGDEPPNPFVWFTLSCDESVVDAVVAAVQALPMVVLARERTEVFPAGSISYGTNPLTSETLQIQPGPRGVDAIYAWQVAGGAGDGVRVADIEGGWLLGHDELLTANIRKISVFGSAFVDHGTAVAGIVVGSDNGVGTIGIVPNAEFDLVTLNRGSGNDLRFLNKAIDRATASLERGDVLLIEVAAPFLPAAAAGPDILVEFDPAVQIAISLATKKGITVIEPAGNLGIDLDAFPFLAHTRPDSPTFSGAIVVGAGEATLPLPDPWSRTFSSFGSRVDCFAAGSNIRAPSSVDHDSYQVLPQFSGTSGASAIIAGVVLSLQAMTRASSQENPPAVLAPSDVRRLLRSASLGTLPVNPLGAKIGAMPDLRKITRAQRLIRVLPVGAAAIGGNALFIVHLDADNRLVRRHFTLLTGWGQPIPSPTADGSPSPSDAFELTAAQPAVTSSDEVAPISRLVFDAFFSGPGGIHHIFWDSFNQTGGNLETPIAPITAAAQGRALAAVRPLIDLLVLAAISPDGRLVVINGDPQILSSGMSAPLVLDAVGRYRRISGPTIVSRGAGLADIVVVEDGGSLSWFTGRLPAAIGTGWSGPVIEPSAVAFDPGARPALLVTGSLLLAAAVGSDGSLRAATIDPVLIAIDAAVEVDASVSIDTSGPVALGRTAFNVVALAVDKQGTLRAATRLIAGGSWTPLLPVLSPIAISPLGGVTAVTIDIGVMAIVVGVDGIVCSAISVDGLIWSPLVPLP
jgi:hypothetical protein